MDILICLWKPVVYSLLPHVFRNQLPEKPVLRELSWNLKLGITELLLASYIILQVRYRNKLVSVMPCIGLCCQLRKEALPAKKPQHIVLTPITQHESWEADISFLPYATSDTYFSHRRQFREDHFGKGNPTWALMDKLQATPCHLAWLLKVPLSYGLLLSASLQSYYNMAEFSRKVIPNSSATVKAFTAPFA